jgi:hypothetical protein
VRTWREHQRGRRFSGVAPVRSTGRLSVALDPTQTGSALLNRARVCRGLPYLGHFCPVQHDVPEG